MATAKQGKNKKATANKYSQFTYPNEAFFEFSDDGVKGDETYKAQFDPDTRDLFEFPADPTVVQNRIFALTPTISQGLKSRMNEKNQIRKKPTWQKELTERMNRGDWSLMDTVEFDWNGQIGNGATRIQANADSHAIILVNCVFGLNPRNFLKYDDNHRRTIWQLLHMKFGWDRNTAMTIGATSWWLNMYWDAEPLNSRNFISKDQRLETWMADPKFIKGNNGDHQEVADLLAWLQKVVKDNNIKKLYASETVLLTLLVLGSRVSGKMRATKDFIEAIVTGDNLGGFTNPRNVCRNWLESNQDITGVRRIPSLSRVKVGLACLRAEFEDKTVTDGECRFPQPRKALTKSGKKPYTDLEFGGQRVVYVNSLKKLEQLKASGKYEPGKRVYIVGGAPRLSEAEDTFYAELAETQAQEEENTILETVTMETVIEDLELSTRAYNSLKDSGIGTVGDIVSNTAEELLAKPKFGVGSLDEIKTMLNGYGLSLGIRKR